MNDPTPIVDPPRPSWSCHHGADCPGCGGTGNVLGDFGESTRPCPYPDPDPDPRVASLASPDAQARALEAERLLAAAEDAERNGKRYIAGVLRKRVEKMIGRAGVSEAKARAENESNRERNRESDPHHRGGQTS